MKIKLVTTYNESLLKKYAHRFESTYCWPFEKIVYNESQDMYQKIPELKQFIDRNKDVGVTSFVNDAIRFSYKVYAYTHAILNEECDGLIGIDADSVFYKPIDVDWIKEHIHRDDCMMTYLGRGGMYSECGFLYWNMKHPYTRQYALEMKKMYDENLIYKEVAQHDSFIWDLVRERFEKEYEIKNHNIGDNGKMHVQARSILGTVYDHTKGRRKVSGVSPEWEREQKGK